MAFKKVDPSIWNTRHTKAVRKLHNWDRTFSSVDCAYAAGVLDSDGCISVARYSRAVSGVPTYTLTVNVTQVPEVAVRWFFDTFGGSLTKKTHRNPHHQDQWMWTIYSKPAGEFLKLLVPYLRVKKVRAEAAIELVGCMRVRGNKGVPKYLQLSDGELAQRERYARIVREENHKGRAFGVELTSKSLMERVDVRF